ncbi:MAG: ABC transporter permease [Chitinophagaceae bacterium]|nr:MAG: ABC transporter permease [Chitinophagaceae bacterium]
MFRNYLKIALRNILRHKAYSFINIAGLSVGIACSVLILLWVRHEKSYDRFHASAGEIYRITCAANDFQAAVNPGIMSPTLKAEIPAIRNYVRFSHPSPTLFESGNRKFEEQQVFYADSTLLTVFSFRLKEGNPATAMSRPDGVLLTESMAVKYFGDKPALGQVLRKDNSTPVTVTGVFADIPGNSHLQFDFIMPMDAIANSNRDLKEQVWDNFNFYAYLLVDPNSNSAESVATITAKMNALYKTKMPEFQVSFRLQPLTDIHLHSHLQVDLPGHGNVQYVNIFLVVAIFILVVACINFMNLATARSARRAREVGIRKVSGALRQQLIFQFLGESMIISLIALLIAIALLLVFLPLFSSVAGKDIPYSAMDGQFWLGILGITLFTGLLSGSYPALFLSGFRPVKVLKGSLRKAGGSLVFRNSLVVTQFIVSIVLLVGTLVVYRQLQFIRNRSMGFDRENLLYISITGDMRERLDALRSALTQDPLTSNFTLIDNLPTNLQSGTIAVEWDGKDPKSQVVFPTMALGENFVGTLGMKLLGGRGYAPEFRGDSTNYLVNEKALAVMGIRKEEAIGKPLTLWGRRGSIIGVLQDFNFKPVQEPIEPLIVNLNTWGGYVMVRAGRGNTEATIAAMEKISQRLNPAYPFSYNFLDQDIANLYRGEQRLGTLFNIFSILAILISCLGLYGLSAFMAEQRRREIGVRKALGASVASIVYLLSTGFTRLILLSILIATPLAWFAINSWLQGFAYHIEIGWLVFVIAAVAALGIAWLTVGYESVKAALVNPVKSLRTE